MNSADPLFTPRGSRTPGLVASSSSSPSKQNCNKSHSHRLIGRAREKTPHLETPSSFYSCCTSKFSLGGCFQLPGTALRGSQLPTIPTLYQPIRGNWSHSSCRQAKPRDSPQHWLEPCQAAVGRQGPGSPIAGWVTQVPCPFSGLPRASPQRSRSRYSAQALPLLS